MSAGQCSCWIGPVSLHDNHCCFRDDEECHPIPDGVTVGCTADGCGASFRYISARGERARLCLDHGGALMRANGHQGHPHWSVD